MVSNVLWIGSTTGGAGSFENWLADRLLKWLKIETSQSSVIQISYTSGDARFAAQAANAFAKGYIDTMLELRVEPTQRTATWFDEQLKGLRVNLEDAQAKLTEYQRQKKIVATDEKLDVGNLPRYMTSGLIDHFAGNILEDPLSPQKIVHPRQLGYRITMFLFLAFTIRLLGRFNPILIAAVALAGSVGLFWLFNDRLMVILPRGPNGF